MIQKLLKLVARRILRRELSLLDSVIRTEIGHTKRLKEIIRTKDKEIEDSLSREVQIKEVPVYYITKEVYKKHLVDRLEQPVVSSSCTGEQAGYLVGVQRVLQLVREIVV